VTPATPQLQQQQLQLSSNAAPPASDDAPFEAHPPRAWLHHLLVDGGGDFVDVFRKFFPGRTGAYTCWNQKTGARHSNYGTRIDYVLADKALVEEGFFVACDIRPDIQCSDHCPVQADLAAVSLCANEPGRAPPPLCSRFMPEFAGNQQTLQSFFTKKTDSSTASSGSNAAAGQSGDAMARSASAASPSPGAPASTSLKRPLSVGSSASSTSSFVPIKKARTNSSASSTASSSSTNKLAKSAAGTQSLHAFFGGGGTAKTKQASAPAASAQNVPPAADSIALTADFTADVPTLASSLAMDEDEETNGPSPVSSAVPSPSTPSASSSSAWAALLDRKSAAVCCRCGHQAKLQTVGKAGPNQGRRFYVCPLPAGPQQCEFFLWAAQLRSKQGGGGK